jgi:hypothetical protein
METNSINSKNMESRIENFVSYYSDMFEISSHEAVKYSSKYGKINIRYEGVKMTTTGHSNEKDSWKNLMNKQDFELIVEDVPCHKFSSKEEVKEVSPVEETKGEEEDGGGEWTTKGPKKKYSKKKDLKMGNEHDAILSGVHLCTFLNKQGLRVIVANEVPVGHPDLRIRSDPYPKFMGQGRFMGEDGKERRWGKTHEQFLIGCKASSGIIGSIDMLCLDKSDNLVVVDLKTVKKSYGKMKLEELVMKEDHAIQLELYAALLEYMSRRMMLKVNGNPENHLRVAYGVIVGIDTSNGVMGMWKVKRNTEKWILAKGMENRRKPIKIIIDDHPRDCKCWGVTCIVRNETPESHYVSLIQQPQQQIRVAIIGSPSKKEEDINADASKEINVKPIPADLMKWYDVNEQLQTYVNQLRQDYASIPYHAPPLPPSQQQQQNQQIKAVASGESSKKEEDSDVDEIIREFIDKATIKQ